MDRINDLPISGSQNPNNEPTVSPQKQGVLSINGDDVLFSLFENIHKAASNGNIAAQQGVKTKTVATPILSSPSQDPEAVLPIAASKITPALEKTPSCVQSVIIDSCPPPVPPQRMLAIPSRVAEYLENNNKHLSTPSEELISESRNAISPSVPQHNIDEPLNPQPSVKQNSPAPNIPESQVPSSDSVLHQNPSADVAPPFSFIQTSQTEANTFSQEMFSVLKSVVHRYPNKNLSHEDYRNLSPAERELVITYNTETHTAVTSLKGQQYYQQHPEALKSLNLPKGTEIFVLSDSAWKTFTTLLDQKIDEWQNAEEAKKHAHHAPKGAAKTPKESSPTTTKQDTIQNAVTAFENTKQESLAHKLSELFKITVTDARARIEKKRKEQKELQEKTSETQTTEQHENEKVQIEELCNKIEADYEEIERLIIKDLLREQDLNTPDTTITPST